MLVRRRSAFIALGVAWIAYFGSYRTVKWAVSGWLGDRASAEELLSRPPPIRATDPVILEVGAQRLTTSQLELMLSSHSSWQLRALGRTAGEIRQRFVQEVAIPQLLWAERAARAGSKETLRFTAQRDRLLATELARSLAAVGAGKPASVHDEGGGVRITAPDRGESLALRVWWMLVAGKSEAEDVLRRLLPVATVDGWSKLCRERSLDTATRLRGGRLGFVESHGTGDGARSAVPRAVFDAASRIGDGQLTLQAMETGRFAVIWRRGTRHDTRQGGAPMNATGAAGNTPAWAQRVTELRSELVSVLRRSHLGAYQPDLLDLAAFPTSRQPLELLSLVAEPDVAEPQ
jgi:hypothetical protein